MQTALASRSGRAASAIALRLKPPPAARQAPAETREQWALDGGWREYGILNEHASATTAPAWDHERFVEVREALEALGYGADEVDGLFRMLAVVLQLGNLELAAAAAVQLLA